MGKEEMHPCTLAELLQSKCKQLPEAPGVYLVMAPKGFTPQFINPGTGGWLEGNDPNVDIAMLESRWVPGCRVLYIGQGTNLRKRVRLLLKFGQRVPVRHRGGRYLWQISNSLDLLLEWYRHDSPLEEERRLLAKFMEEHGRLPFANLLG